MPRCSSSTGARWPRRTAVDEHERPRAWHGIEKLVQESRDRSMRPIAVMQCAPRGGIALTQDELDALISLVQMASDGTDCTFRDWVMNHPVPPDFLERLELKLFEIDPTHPERGLHT